MFLFRVGFCGTLVLYDKEHQHKIKYFQNSGTIMKELYFISTEVETSVLPALSVPILSSNILERFFNYIPSRYVI